MAAADGKTAVPESESANGVNVIRVDGTGKEEEEEEITLTGALDRFLAAGDPSSTFLCRARAAIGDGAAFVRIGFRNSSQELLRWTRRGSPLRPLLVVSVGTITLLALTGLLAFMLFFVAATANAVVMSLLVSLALAGGFLAFFLACVTAVYVAALSLGVFFISTATISMIVAVLIIAGWVGFFYIIWVAAQKSVHLAKQSLRITGSAVSAYTTARHFHK